MLTVREARREFRLGLRRGCDRALVTGECAVRLAAADDLAGVEAVDLRDCPLSLRESWFWEMASYAALGQ